MDIDNKVLLYVIIGAYIFFTYIMPNLQCNNNISTKVKERLENVIITKKDKLDLNMCSKQCCKFTQWSLPQDLMKGPIPDDQLKDFIGSNYSCNFGEGSGCLCVTKDNLKNITNRGGN
jgi:hypothetical protein